jgi:hypothetical protein
LAFVIFQEKPDILESINDQLEKASNIASKYSKTYYSRIISTMSTPISAEFNKILAIIDRKIGDFNLVKLAEHVANIIEVFCKFVYVDIKGAKRLFYFANSIQGIVTKVEKSMKKLNPKVEVVSERKKQWGNKLN